MKRNPFLPQWAKFLALATWCFGYGPLCAEEKLAIFLPSAHSVTSVQSAFNADPAMKNMRVVVFASFDDFQLALSSDEINYVLVASAYTRYDQEITPIYQLTLAGHDTFRYVVISLAPEWNRDKIGSGIIGIVNTVGRDNTRLMAEDLLKNKFKRIKQVSRLSDLYPLLALGNANYVMFPQRILQEVQRDFTAKPFEVLQTAETSLPVIAEIKAKSHKNAAVFAKINVKTLTVLGMDGLKPLAHPRLGKEVKEEL